MTAMCKWYIYFSNFADRAAEFGSVAPGLFSHDFYEFRDDESANACTGALSGIVGCEQRLQSADDRVVTVVELRHRSQSFK